MIHYIIYNIYNMIYIICSIYNTFVFVYIYIYIYIYICIILILNKTCPPGHHPICCTSAAVASEPLC